MSTATSPPPPHLLTGTTTTSQSPISLLPDDILLKILAFLPSTTDPRTLPRLCGVSRRLRRLLRSPLPSSLPLPLPPSNSLLYPTLHKLTVCCPGLSHAGVILHDHSADFGLSLDIGPDLSLSLPSIPVPCLPPPVPAAPAAAAPVAPPTAESVAATIYSTPTWSLFDDLYLDSSYDLSEIHAINANAAAAGGTVRADTANLTPSETVPADMDVDVGAGAGSQDCAGDMFDCSSSNQPQNLTGTSSLKRRKKHGKKKWIGPTGSHLATGNWSLSREQGSKLLASRFRGDSLYICDWPGCVHQEEKRKYMLFRGVFEDFKKSRVWKTIVDSKKGKIKLDCAYCTCNEMWDLHSAFCLRGFIGFHEDGEPVVRAFVCDNGHVSGAWTERPMYG